MATDFEDEDQGSGRSLRERLEAEIARNKKLSASLAQRVSQQFRFVTADDLAGVDVDELEKMANEIERRKSEERSQILRSALEDQGLPADQLDEAVKRLVGSESADAGEPALDAATARVASLGKLQGTTPASKPAEGLWGAAKIRAAVGSK